MLGDGRTWSLVGSGGVHVFLDGAWEHHVVGGIVRLPLLPDVFRLSIDDRAKPQIG